MEQPRGGRFNRARFGILAAQAGHIVDTQQKDCHMAGENSWGVGDHQWEMLRIT